MRVNLKDLPVGTQFIFTHNPAATGSINETFANNEKYVLVIVGEMVQPPITLNEDVWEHIDLLIDVEYSEIEPEQYYQLTFDDLESGD